MNVLTTSTNNCHQNHQINTTLVFPLKPTRSEAQNHSHPRSYLQRKINRSNRIKIHRKFLRIQMRRIKSTNSQPSTKIHCTQSITDKRKTSIYCMFGCSQREEGRCDGYLYKLVSMHYVMGSTWNIPQFDSDFQKEWGISPKEAVSFHITQKHILHNNPFFWWRLGVYTKTSNAKLHFILFFH